MKLILLFNCLFYGLFSATTVFASTRPIIFVSIIPQKYFVQQISGDRFQVEVMVKPGASPATYEPKPSQMKMLAQSDIYFSIGVPFENSWLPKISGVNRKMAVIETDKGIAKLSMSQMSETEVVGHDSGHRDQHDHDHQGYDPHIWLSPTLVKKQVAVIASSLADYYPQWSSFFKENEIAFLKRIDKLDNDVRSMLDDIEGTEFMVFHPSWGYFARDYKLEQVAIEIEGKKPKSSQLQKLIEHAREHTIKIIFAQPQFSRKSAEVIAREIGGEVLFIDPLAEDWEANMRKVAGSIKKAVDKR